MYICIVYSIADREALLYGMIIITGLGMSVIRGKEQCLQLQEMLSDAALRRRATAAERYLEARPGALERIGPKTPQLG